MGKKVFANGMEIAHKAGDNKAKAEEIGRSNFCTGCKDKNAFVEFQVLRTSPAAMAQDTGEITDPAFLQTLKELKEFAVFAPLPTRSLVRILPCVKRRKLEGGADFHNYPLVIFARPSVTFFVALRVSTTAFACFTMNA